MITWLLLAAAAALTRRPVRSGGSGSPAVGPGRGPTGRLAAGTGPAPLLANRPRVNVLAAAAAGVAAALLLPGAAGPVVGAGVGLGLHRLLGRLEPAKVRRRHERRAAHLPVALDLLAVCLRSGSPLVVALEAVGAALPEPLGPELARVAGLQRLGAGVAAAWSAYPDDPVFGPVTRLVHRSVGSGSALASAFERMAADRRAAAIAAGDARARRAAVLATAPLGLCFLPAFVCLTVVPLVAAIVAVGIG